MTFWKRFLSQMFFSSYFIIYIGFPWNWHELFHFIFQNNSGKKMVSFMTFSKDLFPRYIFPLILFSVLVFLEIDMSFSILLFRTTQERKWWVLWLFKKISFLDLFFILFYFLYWFSLKLTWVFPFYYSEQLKIEIGDLERFSKLF